MRRCHRLVLSLTVLPGLAGVLAVPAAAQEAVPQVFVNEIHYDNDGTDTGEAVEIAGPTGTDVDGWQVVLYNGTDSQRSPYDTRTLDGSIDASQTMVLEYATNGIQNGAPDGLALVDATGDVVQFLSYEGSFTAAAGPAAGRASTDIGVAEDGDTPVGHSLRLVGEGDSYADFTWAEPAPATFGAVNQDQTLNGEVGQQPGDGDDGNGDGQQPAVCDATDITRISTIQGDGFVSELDGRTVTIRAAVTGVFPDLSGVFVQEGPGDVDDDPATSEGLFVFTGSRDLSELTVGATVEATGTVAEHFELTELTDVTELADCGDVDDVTIDPVALELPANMATRESREGMLVTARDLTVTDLFGPFRFGEIGLSGDGILRQPTQLFAPDDPQAQDLAESNAGNLLVVDDRGEFGFQAAPWLDAATPRAGDTVESVTGPLTYTFGEYKVEPLTYPEVDEVTQRPEAPTIDGGPRIATFNVLNLFNGDGRGGGFPTSRGAETYQEYLAQRAGIVAAIQDLDASVVGLIEIENDYGDGQDSSVAQLVDALNDSAGEEVWAYVDPGVDQVGTDVIAVGIVYRTDLADEVGTAATFDIDEHITDNKNRWPLAQSFEVGGETVTLVVNHLKSKGSSCADVSTVAGFDADYAFDTDPSTDLEGSCNLTRVYAANQLLEWVETDPTGVEDDDLIGGDLNAYAQEDPIRVFEDAGYVDLVERFDPDESSYAFDGRYGTLDYLLASPAAAGDFVDAEIWNINSPEPYGWLYFNLDEDGVYASSDHDPVLAAYPEVDVGAPEIDLEVSPDEIWPPNRRYVELTIDLEVDDDLDDDPQVSAEVTSDEADDGLYGGDRPNDVVGSLADGFRVRAERDPGGDGRTYTVAVTATDAAGNTTTVTETVEVPHDQGRADDRRGRGQRGRQR